MELSAPQIDSHALTLEEQIARLQALLEATRRVHSTIATQEVLLQTASILVRELEMEGAVFLAPGSDETLAAYGNPPEEPLDLCPRFPLLARDGSLLATLVVRTGVNCSLSVYEQDFIEGLVLQAAVALENTTLHERDLHWARVQRDLEAARDIQRSLLPTSMPVLPGFSLAWRSETCYEVGGDYLDTMELPGGAKLFIVADVAGKGLASAIVATSFRSAFRSLAGQNLPLSEMMERISNQHWAEGPEARRRYVTAILVRLDVAQGRLEFVNAGHNPGMLVGSEGSVHLMEASGPPLGILPAVTYRAESHAFPAGSRLLLYTDGITEVFCGDEEFGCDRVVELFRSETVEGSSKLLDTLWQTLKEFSMGSPQTDDMTALAISHEPSVGQESISA